MTDWTPGPIITDQQLHKAEWAPGWEYKQTWLPKDSTGKFPEPKGEGWVLNVEAGEGGFETRGRISVAYWRRKKS